MEFEQMIKWVASYLLIAASALGQVAVWGKAAISGQVVSGPVVLGAGVFTPPAHTTTLGSTILGASNQTCLDKDGDGYAPCKGSGSKSGEGPSPCVQCSGTGEVHFQQGFFAVSRPCPQCHGEGSVIK